VSTADAYSHTASNGDEKRRNRERGSDYGRDGLDERAALGVRDREAQNNDRSGKEEQYRRPNSGYADGY
jgi:hypothetical protein